MAKEIGVAVLGCGTIGSGTVKILENNAKNIELKLGIPVVLKKILELDVAKARAVSQKAEIVTDFAAIVNDENIDIVVELMGGENPAKDFMLQALQAGKHVVTANKDVVAKYGQQLFAAAAASKVNFLFEASVGGGIPIIRPLKQCLVANNLYEVMGIVNGTTNYMLTKMTGEGMDYAAVLAEAQSKGYAEANPASDVGGFDAARKIAILASIAFGARVTFDDVYVEGIDKIDIEDIEYAKELGYVIKLVAIGKQDEKGINVRVHPALLPKGHPLASVNDVFNAIFIKGDAVGETMFYGRGAGQMPTASAVVADVMDAARDMKHKIGNRILCTCLEEKPVYPIDKTYSAYYIRLLVEDKPGVLASIAASLGAEQVSIHSVIQKKKVGGHTEIVLLTYRVLDEGVSRAMTTIKGLACVHKVGNVIRVEMEEN
ncbi:MAG: homoserine dehydrogenase [Sporomusaceae bacterium]|jgi:homoserine dehydrogenase|nr:homoserine dehydrogenase [Sporomusaceae bacterium]